MLIEKIIDRALATAHSLVGVQEVPKDSNRGPEIDRIQEKFGMKGQQYCVMFALYCYLIALEELKIKITGKFAKIASSQTLFEEMKKLDCIETDFSKLREGDIVIWRKFLFWQGHAEIAIEPFYRFDNSFKTIGGNTQPSTSGDQRNGGGIYLKHRYANKTDFSVDNFYLRGFINMRKYLECLKVSE